MADQNEVTAQMTRSIRDKIRLSLAEAIPEDVWQQMIQKEIDDFMLPRHPVRHMQETKLSDFQLLVRAELEQGCQQRVRDLLNGPEWASYWDGHRQVTSQFVSDFFRQHAAEIVQAFLGQAFQNAIDQAKLHR